jgi:SAM-dependent methyltransferase
MSVLGRWRATAEELYREIVQLSGAAAGQEIVVSGCGDGTTVEWLAARTGAAVTGVDRDAVRIAAAERRIRARPRTLPVVFEQSRLDDLPHESNVFDVAIGEPLLSTADDPAAAVAELARVTKPMGTVILMQVTWSSDIAPAVREVVVERLGLRPFLLVEWKQMLRDAGIVEIQVQDWTSGGTSGEADGAHQAAPGPQLTWQQKMHIMGRAWRRWGWREARGAVAREQELLRELSRERALGFQLIHGVKWPHAIES